MPHAKLWLRSAALASSLLCATFSAHAANNFTVQNGTWVVTSEVDGKPGRGMTIDVQDGMLVLAVYNYEKSGQPTFHLASGTLDGSHFSGALVHYKNGRYYGSGPLDGAEDGQAGTVRIDFDSASTGTIQFPGEEPAAISRFTFDGIPAGAMVRPGVLSERWLMAELDDSGKPVNALLVTTGSQVFSPSPQTYPALMNVQSYKDGDSTAPASCSHDSATGHFKCAIQFTGQNNPRTLEWSKHLESMSGTMTYLEGDFSPAVWRKRKVVGMRLNLNVSAVAANAQMDAPAAGMGPPSYFVTPDPGIWIISSELTGKPGRGMSIDVQYDNLVLAVYNYESTGAATFHLASGPYTQNKAAGQLIRYGGGRYFGGPAQSAKEVADSGQARLSFATPSLGTIEFPGEPQTAIERFRFGALAPQPESLFGGWLFYDPIDQRMTYLDMNSTSPSDPTAIVGSGGGGFAACRYAKGADEAVRCTDFSPVLHDEFRFTPVNGRALGTKTVYEASHPIYVLRVKDRHGNLAGLGRF